MKRMICKACGVEYECQEGTPADRTGLCHYCNFAKMEAITGRLDRIEQAIKEQKEQSRELPLGICHLCHEDAGDDKVVIYTGRAVCRSCARAVARDFMRVAQ